MRTNLHDLVAERAGTDGGRPALTYKRTTLTYEELRDQIATFAAALVELGIHREGRVAVFLDKRIETVVAIFGASAAGAAFVPINPVLRPRQVQHILADCSVSVLVTSRDRLDLLDGALDDCPQLGEIILVDGDDVGTGNGKVGGARRSVHAWPGPVGAGGPLAAEASNPDTDVAAIFYTSGSTGMPKGVVLSHRNLLVGAESVSQYLENSREDVILGALPLSFDAGFSQLSTAFNVGAHVVLFNYLLPSDVPRLCARHDVTGLTCVPPLWIKIAALDWPEEAATLRYFANTGGRLPAPTLEQLRAKFPQAKPYLMYGLTEAFRSTYLDPDEVDNRPGSIGKAIPNAEVLVARPDGTLCEPGEEGELVHRGALVAQGYWNDPERSAERFKPAPGRPAGIAVPELAVWSGDRVVADQDGFLYFVGRDDEMIKTSGYRVSPTEIEEAAYATGLVSEAAALGVADAELGQRVVLVVSPSGSSLDEEDLLEPLRSELPRFMVPEVSIRPELPRSPNGKLDRAKLAMEYAS